VLNLGGQEPINLLDLARLVIEVAGKGSVQLIPWPENRQRIDVGDVYSSYDLIHRTLGWEPVTPLREGLGLMIPYFEKHLHQYR